MTRSKLSDSSTCFISLRCFSKVRQLTMARSRLFASLTCCVTFLVVRTNFALQDPTCLELQQNKQHIWALGGNGNDSYVLITSKGYVFTNIAASNLVEYEDGAFRLKLDKRSQTIKEAFPLMLTDIKFGSDRNTKLFIGNYRNGQGPFLGYLDMSFDGNTWLMSCLSSYDLNNGGKSRGHPFCLSPNQIDGTNGQNIDFIISTSLGKQILGSYGYFWNSAVKKTCVKVFIMEEKDSSKLEITMPYDDDKYHCLSTATLDDRPVSAMFITLTGVFLFFRHGRGVVTYTVMNLSDTSHSIMKERAHEMKLSYFIDCKQLPETTIHRITLQQDITTLMMITDESFLGKNMNIITCAAVSVFVVGVFFYFYCYCTKNSTSHRRKTKHSRKRPVKKRSSYKPSKIPVSTDSSRVFSVVAKISKASSNSISKASRDSKKSVVRRTFSTRKSKVSKASKTSTTSNASSLTTTSQIVKKSKASKTSQILKKPTAFTASRASPAFKKLKKKKPKASRVSPKTSVTSQLNSMRKSIASLMATSKKLKQKIRK